MRFQIWMKIRIRMEIRIRMLKTAPHSGTLPGCLQLPKHFVHNLPAAAWESAMGALAAGGEWEMAPFLSQPIDKPGKVW